MNPIIMSSFLFGVVAVLATVNAQQGNCGCAPQPTIIQLSCGGNNGGSGGLPPPPPPQELTQLEMEQAIQKEFMHGCEFDADGYPTIHPPGGFPAGFRITKDEEGNPVPFLPPGFELPSIPPNWDGSLEALGYEVPRPGTPAFNMFMCIPLPVITI